MFGMQTKTDYEFYMQTSLCCPTNRAKNRPEKSKKKVDTGI